MANNTRQVPKKKSESEMWSPPPVFWYRRWYKMDGPPGAKRRYPGEREARNVLAYLDHASPAKREPFLKIIRASQFQRNHRGKMRRDANLAYEKLNKAVKWPEAVYRVWFESNVRKPHPGLSVLPPTREGQAALAVIDLAGEGKLNRIRQCLRCGDWFYARFTHQRFCNDPEKKCQWNHYHTSEWRKKHREQNRKHQGEYRERNPGRRQ